MKLAVKLILTVVLGIVFVLAIDGYVSFKHQRDLFEEDMRHDIRVLGLAMRQLVVDTWAANGRERAWRVIQDANQAEPSIDIRWVWLDAPQGDPHAPRVSHNRLEPVIQGRDLSRTVEDKQGTGHFYAYFPIVMDSERLGGLEFHESLSQLDALDRRALFKIIVLTGALVLFSAVAALLLGVRMVGRPLVQVVEKMRRVGTGDFSGPLSISGHDELDELAMGVNTMCEQLTEAWAKVQRETEARIAALEQLRHEDRLKTVGRLASGIAHELGTPLNVISGYAGMIEGQSLSLSETSEVAKTIKAQSERITSIIRQLLDFARRRKGQKTVVDLNLLVNQTMDLIAPLAQKQDFHLLRSNHDTVAKANVDVEQIKQVLLNLMTNALQAMPQGGDMEVGVDLAQGLRPEFHTKANKHYVRIWIHDEGEGIPAEHLNHIFEPFYTTKDTGKGTGLGLSIAEGIVREHDGWISVESQPGQGSCFSVYLPIEGQSCPDDSLL